MPTPRTDHDLLRAYVERRDDAAFGELVARHADMVYASALRQVGRTGLAEDVTQAAFILLARKAGGIAPGVVVAAWLHKATRYAALNAMKIEQRRRAHERRAGERSAAAAASGARRSAASGADVNWSQGAALLDEGVARLAARDREAVVLRFLERRSFAEVGRALGVSEEAAQMRVGRAIEKLRVYFRRHGLLVTTASLRAAVNANAVVPAPGAFKLTLGPTATGHAASVADVAAPAAVQATAPAGASPHAAALADAAGRAMAWSAVRSVAPATAGGVLVAAALALLLVRFVTGDVAQGPPPATVAPATRNAEEPRPGAFAGERDGPPPSWAAGQIASVEAHVRELATPRPLVTPPSSPRE